MEIKTSKFIVRIHSGLLTDEERKTKIIDVCQKFISYDINSTNFENRNFYMDRDSVMDA